MTQRFLLERTRGRVDCVEIERRRIEGAPAPLEHGVALFVGGVADRREEVRVARRATYVLGRAGIGAVQALLRQGQQKRSEEGRRLLL